MLLLPLQQQMCGAREPEQVNGKVQQEICGERDLQHTLVVYHGSYSCLKLTSLAGMSSEYMDVLFNYISSS